MNLQPFIDLADKFDRDARTYSNQNPPVGSSPKDITPEQQDAVNASGAFRVAAHELRQVITAQKKTTL